MEIKNYENEDSNNGLQKYGDDEKSIIDIENNVEYNGDNYQENMGNKEVIYDKEKMRGSSVGYVLGLIGSTFSLVACFFVGLGVFLFKNISQGILFNIVSEIYDEVYFYDPFIYSEDFLYNIFDSIEKLGIVIFIIILAGVIMGFLGTIKSWNNVSILSSSIMIVGGIFSLLCLIFPGVLLIIGGALNMKCAVDKAK